MNRSALAANNAAALRVPVRGVTHTCRDRHACCNINRLRDTVKKYNIYTVNNHPVTLARVRRIATFFRRSTTANHILKEKQKLLQLPAHKLTVDVVTRWNSALDTLERFLEQQPAISATLLSQDVRRNEKDLCTLTEEDVTIAEDLVRALKPVKEATLAMSEDKQPTLSVITPLLALLQEALTPSLEDSTVVRDLKAAAKNNLRTRYDAQKDTLYAASALDPRFKALPSLSAKETPSPDCSLRLPLLHV
ncbi:E3 SUMO-protein ligase ZBED1-like isoform X1 [Epinephelus fuscoguttatus]|uniref:E3 SUMO-protein ligase ZBED1-like isoform X1 n=1 Tax=Epinephelus fuscoguttatus TaxID=293821 RepID=UPI0020CFE8D3|nr:E3 SUMO-protein ligase ZBED1-like isoform X1 [Epinephelus fuscoguttatus]